MFLILYIKDHNHGAWLASDDRGAHHKFPFPIVRGEDGSLKYLDKFFRKFRLSWRRCEGIALVIHEASLTQVKVFATVINVLGWRFQLPLAGSFYEKKDLANILPRLLKKLKSHRRQDGKFKPLKVKYNQQPDITIAPTKLNYHIVK